MSELAQRIGQRLEQHDFDGARAELAALFDHAGAGPLREQVIAEHLKNVPLPEKVVGLMLGVMKDLSQYRQSPLQSFRITMRLDGTECGLHGLAEHQTRPSTPLYDHGIRYDEISMAHKAVSAFLPRTVGEVDGKEAYLLLKATLYGQETAAWMGQLVRTPEVLGWSAGRPVRCTYGAGLATGGPIEDLFRVPIVK